MSELSLKESANILPESFYDILAYIVPSIYLIAGFLIGYDIRLNKEYLSEFFGISWVLDFFAGFLLLAGLYIIGTILTTISYFLIFVPTRGLFVNFLKKEIKDTEIEKYYGDYGNLCLVIKMKKPLISLEITKRYARLVSIRNIALTSLALIIIFFATQKYSWLVLAAIILIFSYGSFVARFQWLAVNFRQIFEKSMPD